MILYDSVKQKYVDEKYSLLQVANEFNISVEEVVKYLRMQGVGLRQEVSAVERAPHQKFPSNTMLDSKLSIALHTMYLCEGWHTEKTDRLAFYNTDPLLINLFIKGMKDIYSVEKFSIFVVGKSKDLCVDLFEMYPNAFYTKDVQRKTPIVRVRIPGSTLARVFLQNAYNLAVAQ